MDIMAWNQHSIVKCHFIILSMFFIICIILVCVNYYGFIIVKNIYEIIRDSLSNDNEINTRNDCCVFAVIESYVNLTVEQNLMNLALFLIMQ